MIIPFTIPTGTLADGKEDAPFLEKISGSLLAAMPKECTPGEVAAIKKGSIFRGVKTALEYTIGFPEKTNDWGRGGTQLIYFSDTLRGQQGQGGMSGSAAFLPGGEN